MAAIPAAMRRGNSIVWALRALIGALALVLLAPAPALANPPVRCMAAATLEEGLAEVQAEPGRWQCGSKTWRSRQPSTFIRFPLTYGKGEAPVTFVTRATSFSAISLEVKDSDGSVRSRIYRMDDVRGVTGGPWIVLALPPVTSRSVEVIARIDQPWLNNAISDARLDGKADGSATSFARILFYAALSGLLLAPLLLNIAFYRVLRERFILWHFALVSVLLSQVLVTTGLINALWQPPLEVTAFYSFFVYSLSCAAGQVFTAHFLEPDKLDPRLRRALLKTAPYVVLVGLILCQPLGPLRPWASMLFHISLMPTVVLVLCSLVSAWRRGSRMVRFQIVGWLPPILAGSYRIANYLVANGTPDDALLFYNASLGIEMLATTAGTLSRLLLLRRERDLAQIRASQLETAASHDPLTGLANRHDLERRFTALYADGFRTMALVDLDRFKRVNDQFGHATGDAVLCAAAEALAPDEDTHVVRLGGEEFLLMLRGPDAHLRAEQRRQAIPLRVAARVPGLDGLVTASMGLVQRDHAASLRTEFREVFEHCDRLLYEAKHNGRNRTLRERVQSFEDGPPARLAAG